MEPSACGILSHTKNANGNQLIDFCWEPRYLDKLLLHDIESGADSEFLPKILRFCGFLFRFTLRLIGRFGLDPFEVVEEEWHSGAEPKTEFGLVQLLLTQWARLGSDSASVWIIPFRLCCQKETGILPRVCFSFNRVSTKFLHSARPKKLRVRSKPCFVVWPTLWNEDVCYPLLSKSVSQFPVYKCSSFRNKVSRPQIAMHIALPVRVFIICRH